MADVIVVLNAGSSSLKFWVFVARGGGLEPDRRSSSPSTATLAHPTIATSTIHLDLSIDGNDRLLVTEMGTWATFNAMIDINKL